MATIDDVKNYWNARPCNIRHSTAEVGTKRYFDEVEARKYMVEPHIPGFAQFDRWKGKLVLEVGCGIGTDTINFLRAGAFVTAIDVSEESLKLTRRRAQIFGFDQHLAVVHGNAEELPQIVGYPAYDLIYSFGVLHHTPNPERAFAELVRFADRNTVFKLMVYNRNSAKVARLTKGRLWRDDLVARQSEAQTGCPVTYTYTAKSIEEALAPNWKVTDQWVDHIFPYKIDDYVNYEYNKTLAARLPGFHTAEKLFGWHRMVEARLSV